MTRKFVGGLIVTAMLLSPATHADMGKPNLEGTWSLTIRGLTYDMPASSKKLLPVSTSATMMITQVEGGRLHIQIDGTSGALDLWTPTPDFAGDGLVGNSTWVANACATSTDFAQSIFGTADASGTAMSGEWLIIENRIGQGKLVTVQFTAARVSKSNPAVSGCD